MSLLGHVAQETQKTNIYTPEQASVTLREINHECPVQSLNDQEKMLIRPFRECQCVCLLFFPGWSGGGHSFTFKNRTEYDMRRTLDLKMRRDSREGKLALVASQITDHRRPCTVRRRRSQPAREEPALGFLHQDLQIRKGLGEFCFPVRPGTHRTLTWYRTALRAVTLAQWCPGIKVTSLPSGFGACHALAPLPEALCNFSAHVPHTVGEPVATANLSISPRSLRL